jgi:hypothetical protein
VFTILVSQALVKLRRRGFGNVAARQSRRGG